MAGKIKSGPQNHSYQGLKQCDRHYIPKIPNGKRHFVETTGLRVFLNDKTSSQATKTADSPTE
jgi:hypothetical protein